MMERERTADDPKHSTSSVKHGADSVMAWMCKAANGTGTLTFIDEFSESNRMKREV